MSNWIQTLRHSDNATYLIYTLLLLILAADSQTQLGFAHGFLVLSETATFFYKCDNFYNKESEGGIIFNDSSIGIDWNFDTEKLIISEKDKFLPTLENARKAW